MMQMTFDDLHRPPPFELLTPDDLYDRLDEDILRSLIKEDRRIEKKASGCKGGHLAEYFSMWANTSPHGGIVVVGIRNDKTFEGLSSIGAKLLNELEKTHSVLCPDARVESKRVQIHRDADHALDFVVAFRVYYHKTRVVKTSSGKAFTRIGDTKHELSPDEVRHLQADKGELAFEDEATRVDYPGGFDANGLDNFVGRVREDKGWSTDHSREDILELMHLGSIKDGTFVPNVACGLLYAKDTQRVVPGCKIRCLRFEGEDEGVGDKWNAIKDDAIEGTIPQLIKGAAEWLRSQLRTFSRLGDEGKFFTSPEYPEVAWYEAIVNACAHRSYGNGLSNMATFVKMFDDRLEIESPGPLPPFVTPETIYVASIPRNPFLMEALRHLDYVKAAREGTRRMRETMTAMGLPAPEFEQTQVGRILVRVTLRNNIKHRRVWVDADVATLLGAQLAQKLDEPQKRFLNFMAEHGKINASDAARLCGRTWHYAKKLLDQLADMGIVERVGRTDIDRDPKAHYRLKRP